MHRMMLMAVLAFLSFSALAGDDFACTASQNERASEKFTLEVTQRARAPGQDVALRFCKMGDKTFLLVREAAVGRPQVKKVPLMQEESARLLGLYEAALDMNLKDEAIGLDGASWCLETARGMNNLKACFWSPPADAQKRGLAGLVALGTALWNLAGLDAAQLD